MKRLVRWPIMLWWLPMFILVQLARWHLEKKGKMLDCLHEMPLRDYGPYLTAQAYYMTGTLWSVLACEGVLIYKLVQVLGTL